MPFSDAGGWSALRSTEGRPRTIAQDWSYLGRPRGSRTSSDTGRLARRWTCPIRSLAELDLPLSLEQAEPAVTVLGAAMKKEAQIWWQIAAQSYWAYCKLVLREGDSTPAALIGKAAVRNALSVVATLLYRDPKVRPVRARLPRGIAAECAGRSSRRRQSHVTAELSARAAARTEATTAETRAGVVYLARRESARSTSSVPWREPTDLEVAVEIPMPYATYRRYRARASQGEK
jgi:hypothetical protein